MSNWIYLSYEMNENLSNYGGAKGISIEWVRRMDKGDTSNNSALQFPAHTGTHIDYPLHFYKEGKTGSDYLANQWVFNKVGIIDISTLTAENDLIAAHQLESNLESSLEFLMVKTGFCNVRDEEKYWKHNWGFAPECATFLRKKFPRLRAIGFDLISLSAYQQREIGRVAHKEFLEKNDLLIVEDMDLKLVNAHTDIQTIIISPLRFTGADGAPVTIMAHIK